MPINEILAPTYAHITYTTTVTQHKGRVYFNRLPDTVNPTDPNLSTYDCGSLGDLTISQVIQELYTRANTTLGASIAFVNRIEYYVSVTSGSNDWIADLDPLNPTGGLAGTASGYYTVVARGANRQKFVFNLYDSSDGKPQRFGIPSISSTDDGSLYWFLVKGNTPFATQDGSPLKSVLSLNTGYNRKLARSYGRTVSP